MIRPLLADRELDALRAVLAPFTPDAVDEVLGPIGRGALGRADLAGARRAVRGADGPVAALLELFTLGQPLDERRAAAVFGPAFDAVLAAGIVERFGTQVRALLDVRPYAEDRAGESWWVVSDLGSEVLPGRELPRDHVLGIGSASLTLAHSTVRAPVGRALDIGTGSGVQALHLSTHARRVTATDISPRALAMAATTAALSGRSWDMRQGSLLDPVVGERFDLVVANPPFVVSPGDLGYDYRDSGLAGDAVCRTLVAGLPGVLAPGGCAQLLANWVIPAEGAWQERVGGWLEGAGCDAWVWQRELADPGEYVALWLRDSGSAPGDPGYAERYDAWSDWMVSAGVAAVGMGLITLWRTESDTPTVVLEDVPQAVEQPAGPHIADWVGRQRVLAGLDDAALLGSALRPAPGVVLDSSDLLAGGSGWERASTALRQSYGMRWSVETDDAIASLVASCDGSTSLGTATAVLAASLGQPADAVSSAVLPVVRDLVGRGFLLPAVPPR